LRLILRTPLSRWYGHLTASENDFLVCEKGIV